MVKLMERRSSKMKNVMTIVMLVAVVMLAGTANAAYLVNTTFEEGSPSANDWKVSNGTAWDDKDPASGVNWTSSNPQDGGKTVFVNNGGDASLNPFGSQYGYLKSNKAATDGSDWSYPRRVSATLAFDSDGGNGGIQTLSWYHHLSRDGNNPNVNVYVRDRNGNEAARIRFRIQPNAVVCGIYYDNYEWTGYIGTEDLSTWYHNQVTFNFDDQKITSFKTGKGTYTAGTGWSWDTPTELLSSELTFIDSTDSFDTIYIICNPDSGSDGYARFDNITVPEPATMTLLLLGLPFALRRRR